MATSPTTAVSAASFVSSIGVNIHMWETTSGYGNLSLVENSLAYLGVANVRDNFLTSSVPAFSALASSGYKLDLAIAPASINIPTFVTQVDAFNAAHPGSIKAIEGPNEVNIWTVNYNGGSSLANAAQFQQAFYSAVRADHSLSNIPVYNLSLAYLDTTQYAQVGDLSASANYANSHAYLNNAYGPQWSLNIILPLAKLDATGLPTVITETGYNTDPNDGYSGVDQTVQAKYTLDTLMDAYKDGVATTYLYELLDDVADPGNTNAQYHYGLFNSDGSPKLAASAIHNLTTILADPSASSSFTPGTLNYSVSNLTAAYGNQLLLQKSNGAFDLVLWADPKIYNPSTDTEIAAAHDTVTVNFAQVEGTVTVFDPLLGNTPIATYHNVQQIQVDLTDHPLVVEISNGSTPVAGPPAPIVVGFSPDSNIVGDGITDMTVLTLTGTAEAGSTVTVFDGAKQLGTATANASGAWSYTTGTLASAGHSFTAKATDVAGNTSTASAALNVTVDAVAPNAPAISLISPDSGVAGDGITNATVLTLTGTAEAGSTVTVFDGAKQLGTATANASGAWSYTTGTLASAGHSFTAKATDVAGNTSTASTALNVTVDAVAPNAPIITSDAIVNSNEVLLTGTAEANSTLAIFEGAAQIGTVVASANGAWSFTTGPLPSGDHAFTATATDIAGNVSLVSQALDPTVGMAGLIEAFGSTSLVEVGNNFLLDNSAGAGPELKYGSAPVAAGQFGAWTPIGAEQTANGYEVAWNIPGTDQYTVWTTDNNGKYLSNIGTVSGTSSALESLEASFHQDLNGDGHIGPSTTVIESFGSTSLVEVGNNFFLDNSAGAGPELKYGSAPVAAGQFGAWTPIGAEQTANGYEVAWNIPGTDQYTVWTTDNNGKYLSNIGTVSGTSSALESLEASFHQDLNGDGHIGASTTVIESFGSTSLVETGNSFFLDNSAGAGPELTYGSAPVAAGQFGAWTPIGAEQTANGYEVAWKVTGADKYTVWTTDSSGKYLSDIGTVSGTSSALQLLETTFHQDLNGDGVVGSSSGSGAAAGPVNIVIGTAGNDTIASSAANDIFFGKGGNDLFVFGTTFGKDIIADFQASGSNQDILQFSSSTFSNFAAVLAHAAQVGSDVVITADALDTVTLQNVHLASLQKSDIHIV